MGIHSFPHSLLALLVKIAHFKERPRVICSRCSLKKSDESDSLGIQVNCLQKDVFWFWQFFPFLCPKANLSHCYLLIRPFVKSDLSNLLPSLFTKEPPWVIGSFLSNLFILKINVSVSLSLLLNKSDVSEALMIWMNRSQKARKVARKIHTFCMFLTVFPF